MPGHSRRPAAVPEHDLTAIVEEALGLAAAQALFECVAVERRFRDEPTVSAPDREALVVLVFSLITDSLAALIHKQGDRILVVQTLWNPDLTVSLKIKDNGPMGHSTDRPDHLPDLFPPGVGIIPEYRLSFGLDEGLNTVHVTFPGPISPARTVKVEASPQPPRREVVEQPQVQGQDPGGDTRSKILIIDDDAAILECMTELLADENVVIETATDGYQGLCKLRETEYDLVLLDMRMPNVDGMLLLKTCARETRDIKDRVIVMSGNLDMYEAALQAMGICRLPKPCPLDELLTLVRDKLSRVADGR